MSKQLLRLFLFFTILMGQGSLLAQNYVYPVATATSWSQSVFTEVERQDLESMQQAPAIEGAPAFSKIFTEFKASYMKYQAYNDSIFKAMPQDQWIDMFGRRSKNYSTSYEHNNLRINTIRDYFSKENCPDAAYDSLYFWARDLYHHNINDIFFMEQLLGILIPHYEAQMDIEHLIFCYSCAGMVQYQAFRMGDDKGETLSELYYHKVLSYADDMATFQNPVNPYYIISSFINVCILHTHSSNVSLSMSRNIANRMEQLYKMPEVKAMMKKDAMLAEFADWSIDIFHYRGIMAYIHKNMNVPQLRDQLYESYKQLRNRTKGNLRNLKHRYYAKLEYDDLLIEAYMGNMSWDDAYAGFEKLLHTEADFSLTGKTTSQSRINYLHNLFESQMYILERTSFDFSKKKSIVKQMLDYIIKVLKKNNHLMYTIEKGKILSNLATKPEVIKYLTANERRDLVFRLIVVEQPVTFVHVSMVARLSQIITSHLVDAHPEYFVGFPNVKTPENAIAMRDQLIDYAYQSAIFHDLGKISMPSIINNCFRKLTDHEFTLIKMHPELSKPFFDIDPLFKPYMDVAMGHHKWYDGDGYPASFKNRQSPYFSIINIVTLADCLDAATENIGRNYHRPKSYNTVLEEFDNEASTRYDSHVVKFLLDDKETYNELKDIIEKGRYNFYYKLYQSYLY